ncbi:MULTISPECIES: hypothetical protein [Bradyrhizobium]|uniref:hypothetical protein n=1 Tax=Bradyrhizobium TaxID=374 RepID=UPI001EDC5D44|nr:MULTISPECIES: hypothetical protein [Bradyrhizobium]MCG2640086.1 hypothetical protein [Bradyrhizobium zhengyangense]
MASAADRDPRHHAQKMQKASHDIRNHLREDVSNEYDAMAEDFEKKEHELFGEDGFEKMAARVAQLEQQMGIHDLNQFTPR